VEQDRAEQRQILKKKKKKGKKKETKYHLVKKLLLNYKPRVGIVRSRPPRIFRCIRTVESSTAILSSGFTGHAAK
jgi:hypothetical protein